MNFNRKIHSASLGATEFRIPDFDKGRGDSHNPLAVFMSVIEDGLYRLGTFEGFLKQLYVRS